ncbi:MAG: hypothetical protein KatS3mg015_1838 [Fimbriimonadales bacterium]|nr:MAG: hypothetical protein KatS3mg015_1838 [Fimbriimonadales bacterium]
MIEGILGAVIGGGTAWGSLEITRRVASGLKPGEGRVDAANRVLLALTIKIPAVAIVVFLTSLLGETALWAFLVGFGLVYFPLLWGTVRKNRAPED